MVLFISQLICRKIFMAFANWLPQISYCMTWYVLSRFLKCTVIKSLKGCSRNVSAHEQVDNFSFRVEGRMAYPYLLLALTATWYIQSLSLVPTFFRSFPFTSIVLASSAFYRHRQRCPSAFWYLPRFQVHPEQV